MRGLLALVAVGVARLAASRARTGSVTLQPVDATVAQLRALIDEFFAANISSASIRKTRHDGWSAQRSRQARDRHEPVI